MSLTVLFNQLLRIEADAIASAEAVNAASTVLVSAPAGIGSAEVLGTVAPVLVCSIGGIASSESVGDAQSTLGDVVVAPPRAPEPVYGMGAPPRRPRRPKPRPHLDDAPYIPSPIHTVGVGGIASAEAVSMAMTTLGPVPGRKRRREEELLLLYA